MHNRQFSTEMRIGTVSKRFTRSTSQKSTQQKSLEERYRVSRKDQRTQIESRITQINSIVQQSLLENDPNR